MAAATTQKPFDPFAAPHDQSIPTIAPLRQTSTYTPRDVATTLNYFLPNADGSPPKPAYVGRPETYVRPTDPHPATIHDIRGSESQYSLDTTGFQIFRHESREKDFVDDAHIKEVYYPEIEDILKKAVGAHKVFIFDHTIRRVSPSQDTQTLRGPVQRVHIDQSYRAGRERVSHHLPEEAEKLLQGRYQIINVWRPIKTILKDPLTVAEAHSVNDEELVTIGLIYPDREGETYSVKYAPQQKWYYLNEQSPSEVLLIKCFDSKTDGRARRVPHTSFTDAEREDEAPRESIEVRALVFSDN